MRRTLAHAMAVLGLLAVYGCSDDPAAPSPNTTGAPALPAASTMQMTMDFPGVPSLTQTAGTVVASATHDNWINAYSRASFVVLSVYDHLEEPAAAFAAAIHSHPQKQEDGSWLWTYIFVDEESGDEYSVYLYGARGEEAVLWRMEVSSNDTEVPLDHFVWFAGESAFNGRSGWWQFYTPVDASSGVPSARVDWIRSLVERRLTILMNGEGLEGSGDSLDLHETVAQSSIHYEDVSAEESQNITWYPDGSGHLTAPDYNGGATACWDTDQADVACE